MMQTEFSVAENRLLIEASIRLNRDLLVDKMRLSPENHTYAVAVVDVVAAAATAVTESD